MMPLEWNEEEAIKRITAVLHTRLDWACRQLTNHAKREMNIAAEIGRHKGRSRTEGTQIETPEMGWKFRGKRKTFKDYEPSAPGEYPRKRTGRLRMSVAFEWLSDLVARWGTNVPYGRWLEFGTRHMAPRPWMSRTNAEVMPRLQQALNGSLSAFGPGASE